jgi:hypothetical protein
MAAISQSATGTRSSGAGRLADQAAISARTPMTAKISHCLSPAICRLAA